MPTRCLQQCCSGESHAPNKLEAWLCCYLDCLLGEQEQGVFLIQLLRAIKALSGRKSCITKNQSTVGDTPTI